MERLNKAIGMIETKGLIYSYEAADAMIKASNVTLVSQNLVDAGIVTITVEGDVGAVQAAVDAGKERVLSMNGHLLSAHVIPRADEAVYQMVKPAEKAKKQPKQKAKPTEKKNTSEKK